MDCQLYIIPILYLLTSAQAFYVPGVAPVEFKVGDPVEVKAVKMTSLKTQLPYEYYSLPFCRPSNGIIYKAENLGEILRGDRIVNTAFDVHMNKAQSCVALCSDITLTKSQASLISQRITESYSVHLLVDNLPAATAVHIDGKPNHYEHGFLLGFVQNDKVFINNHLRLTIKYHTNDDEVYRVVGFEVSAHSIAFDQGATCHNDATKVSQMQLISASDEQKIRFTYDVLWVKSDIRWASRWDTYLTMSDVQIHWFSIINSVIIIFFLSGILTLIMIRTLRKDIATYNQNDDIEETFEETGWKLVHGDVFRTPRHFLLLSALLGSGLQLFFMIFITIFLAMLGMLSPASRGALMSAAVFVYVFMGLVAGYFGGRIYKTLRGVQWKKAALLTSLLFPSIVLGIGFFLNFFIWGQRSSGAVPFTTMLAICALWCGISLPLVFVGHFFGFRKQAYHHPVRTNQIPRCVPQQKWYTNIFASTCIAGVLPFGAVFIELFFIFTAIWERQFYYLFGFLFVVFIILIISVSQISIVMVYFQLCNEDYHWWWRSFVVSGGSALYVFMYSIFYFVTKLEITAFIPTLLYFGYSFLITFTFWILTGTIGFYSAYIFLRRIYGAIKID